MTVMQRVRGEARVEIGRMGLRDLRQQGSAKAILPRVDGPDPEVVFLNTAGGVTGGDRLAFGCSVGAGARVTAATQTAERAYRSTGDAGQITVDIDVGTDAHIDWLPQETILFEGSNTRRETTVTLAEGASLLMVESIVLGRAAMGEETRTATLDDKRSVVRGGALIYQDHLSLGHGSLANSETLGGARAFATLVMISPSACDDAQKLRDLPDGAGLSAWDDRLVLRIAQHDAANLRRELIRAIVALRGTSVPRVWQAEQ